jgi:uncharacterized protein (TIGR02001 family)
MKKILPTLFVATAAFAASLTSAAAQEFSANLGVTNNYMWRGITQTDDEFAVQGGADVEFDNGFSAGFWASNVDFGDGTDAEIDLYGGYSFPITEMVSGNVGVIGYFYPGQPSGTDYTFVEFNGGLDFDLGPAVLSGSVAFSPDVGGDTTWYFNAGLGIPLGEYFELFGGIGYYEWQTVTDTFDYNFGVSATWQNFTVSTYYTGTDLPGDDGAFVVALTASVP